MADTNDNKTAVKFYKRWFNVEMQTELLEICRFD